VAEGIRVIRTALESGAPVETLFIASEGREEPDVALLAERAHRAGVRIFELTEGTMERVADTVTPQPVCAVVGALDRPLAEVIVRPPSLDAPAASVGKAPAEPPGATPGRLLLVCVDVRDPGNLGALMRSAAGSGALAVVCVAGTVDPFNPKAVRASAGAVFQVPVVRTAGEGETLAALRSGGFRLVATAARDGEDYSTADWSGDVALLLGNEANGLGEAVMAEVDGVVTVPMAPGTESLNVAMTGTVLCFEAARQRRQGSGGRVGRVATPASPAEAGLS